MRYFVGMGEFLIGLAYTGLGLLTIYELCRERHRRGLSQFGMAFALMAFTCGPHHLLRGLDTYTSPMDPSPGTFFALLVGLPAGLVFVGLRIEALFGGPGDRTLQYLPGFVPMLAVFAAASGGAIIAGLLLTGARLHGLFVLSNVVLIASYLAVGWYILSTQVTRYPRTRTWSLSGVALGFVFPTCALMHAAHVLSGHAYKVSEATAGTAGHVHDTLLASASHTHWAPALVVLDTIGIPASVWFLVVVRRLYHQGMSDWNRKPLVGSSLMPKRSAPWERAAAR